MSERVNHTFHVTYATGKKATYVTGHATVDDFVNTHFGSTAELAAAHGATVVMEVPGFDKPKAVAAREQMEDDAALRTLDAGLADVEQQLVVTEAEQKALAGVDTVEGGAA